MNTQLPNTESSTPTEKRWLIWLLQLLIVLLVAAGFLALRWYNTLPQRVDDQQTVVLGRTHFAPGSEASVRVVVQDFAAGEPIAGAEVKVSFKPDGGRAQLLFEGQTDGTGSVPISFQVPEDAPEQAQLIIETESEVGMDRVEQPMTIEREYRLLLSSDKPLYQPGQIIHMRALALSTFDLTPARGAAVNFLVEDAKGNKVFRETVTASDFGIAAADFTLADMVNQGNYKLSVAIGDTRSEKTVEVRPYVLPKFGLGITTDRTFYLPGQRVEGAVQADYFFGKPVADSEVQLVGSIWDVERTVVVDLHGRTDENGTYAFEFDLPEYFAGSGLDSWQAQFALELTVVDQTDHAEQTSQVLPIAEQPLLIEAVAESGLLKPGVENIIYVLTTYPDGRPAQTQLAIEAGSQTHAELETGEYGLASFAFTPPMNSYHSIQITARDEAGNAASRELEFQAEYGSDNVLLRADRAAYLVGETMDLVVFTPVDFGSVYLDIVKSGQTLSTRSGKVVDGKAEFAVDVSADLYGTIEIHAYKVLLDGTIVRDTRLIVVDAPNEIAIDITADQDTYLPGEQATIDFQTSDAAQGAELETALGLAIVDESVFALQRQDPGFAKLYFMLEQELLEPFYQIKDFDLPAAIPPENDPQQIRLAQDDAAKATMAEMPVMTAAQPINSRPEKMNVVYSRQQTGLERVGQAAAVGMLLIPFALWAVVIVVFLRTDTERKRLIKRLGVASGLLLLIGGCLAGWFIALSESFYYFDVEVIFIPLLLVLGLGMLAFVAYAWIKGDQGAQFLSLLTLGWGALLYLLIKASDQGGEPSEDLTILALLAFALVPGAYLLFGQTRWIGEQRTPGILATGLGAVSAFPVVILVPLLLFSVGSFAPAAPRGFNALDGGDWEMVQPAMEAIPLGAVEKEVIVTAIVEVEGETVTVATEEEAPRLRQYFPETLFWAPEVQTDESGFVSLDIPMADSITTWRLTALASSQDGRLGFTTRGVRVFQDFFVDIDLPVALTQGDEISIPVGVFNYLPEAQEVRLVVEPEDWFELLGEAEQTLIIASNDIDVVYFPIRVLDFGREGFQVTAWGEQMSDAIRREVNVVPDGQEIRLTESDWLKENKEIEIEIPESAVKDTPYVEVKIYPGAMAQVVEGLEKILKLPHG